MDTLIMLKGEETKSFSSGDGIKKLNFHLEWLKTCDQKKDKEINNNNKKLNITGDSVINKLKKNT